MKRIRQIIGSDTTASADDGFTLVEVIVAMVVFAIIAVAVAGSIAHSLVVTKDTRSRTVAVNLASQDLDEVRAISNVFDIDSETTIVPIQGVNYKVARTYKWATSGTSANACGTGGGQLQYLVVTDTVTYPGAGTTKPVVSSTVIAPNSRINDSDTGMIIVSVTGADGAGAAGVTVSITPAATSPNGAAAVATPAVTDNNGCTFVQDVAPGNYTVTVNRANGIDYTQVTTPKTTPVVVTAGSPTSVPFTYDTAATVNIAYATNYTGSVTFPSNMTTTFFSTTNGAFTTNVGSSKAISLFPYTGGYTYEFGTYVAPVVGDSGTVTNKPCVNVDPGAWTTANSAKIVGKSYQATTTPGGTSSVNVPMGVAQLGGLSSALGITATAVNTTANGDPGCSSGATYSYNFTLGSQAIALPFGTWKLTSSLGGGTITPQSLKTPGVINSDGSFTLDPRGVSN
jgi:prepilin-type N-terminal cleavage/methylation domain-containing protein